MYKILILLLALLAKNNLKQGNERKHATVNFRSHLVYSLHHDLLYSRLTLIAWLNMGRAKKNATSFGMW